MLMSATGLSDSVVMHCSYTGSDAFAHLASVEGGGLAPLCAR